MARWWQFKGNRRVQLLLVSTALDDAAQIPMGIVWIDEKATSVLLVNQEQFDLRLTELIRDVVLRQQIQSVPEDRNRSNAAAIQARVHLIVDIARTMTLLVCSEVLPPLLFSCGMSLFAIDSV